MGNEMYSVAVTRRIVCHHTTNVPVLHVAAETIPRCGGCSEWKFLFSDW